MARDEVEAAYFTLLRAREELDAIRRKESYLADELRRLNRFVAEGEALADSVSAATRRLLRTSDEQLAKLVEQRRALIDDERRRMPEREQAAAVFVEECERHHAELAAGR